MLIPVEISGAMVQILLGYVQRKAHGTSWAIPRPFYSRPYPKQDLWGSRFHGCLASEQEHLAPVHHVILRWKESKRATRAMNLIEKICIIVIISWILNANPNVERYTYPPCWCVEFKIMSDVQWFSDPSGNRASNPHTVSCSNFDLSGPSAYSHSSSLRCVPQSPQIGFSPSYLFKAFELRRGGLRRKKTRTNYFQRSGQLIKKNQENERVSILTCSPCTPFQASKPCLGWIWIQTPWACWLTSPRWRRGAKQVALWPWGIN